MANDCPNLFLVGAMKSGTTTLCRYLNSHSKVFMSPIKEPNYFCFDLWNSATWGGSFSFREAKRMLSKGSVRVHSCRVRQWPDYTWLFSGAKGEKWLGEASTSYLYSEIAAKKIKEVSPEARILVSLRNPFDRAYSHYLMEYAIGRTRKKFYQTLAEEFAFRQKGMPEKFGLIGGGMYAKQIERFLDVFGNDRVQIFLFDQLRDSPNRVLHEVADFLGIDFGAFSKSQKPSNQGISPLFPFLNYMLERSSIKKAVKHIMPPFLLAAGKGLYYRHGQDLREKYADMDWAREIFIQDINHTESLIGKSLERWRLKCL